jgi:tRNA pseudouridine55 synthase
LNGFLNMLKPPGMTSHDVVDAVRKQLPGVKAGHGGTLDPGAAGVLPLLLGKATKLAPYLLEYPKIYRAELHLGISTDTADSYGNIIGRGEPPSLGKGELEGYISSFIGDIEQLPPMYSAVKNKGRKLYEYARKGQKVERRPRRVKIYDIIVISYIPPEKVMLEIKCSSGTYVRNLCEELGNLIGCGGHMSFLVRIASGRFQLSKTQSLEELAELARAGRVENVLLPADFPFQNDKKFCLSDKLLKHLFSKKFLSLEQILPGEFSGKHDPVDGQILAVYTTEEEFAALTRWKVVDSKYIIALEKIWKQ